MKCDLENLIRQNTRKPKHMRWALETIHAQMLELRTRLAVGDGEAALGEFLDLWCIKKGGSHE